MGRSRLTIQLTRITLSLPIALEKAVQGQSLNYSQVGESEGKGSGSPILLPRSMVLLIRGVDTALERMERILKPT